ncbi:hypothetical protein HYR54_06690 [Candidatus Acetothermia bacterium]|nr:hypothetical protein [Candidatus Acetothermia bacterium]
MNTLLWLGVILACVYGIATSVAGVSQLKTQQVPHWAAIAMITVGALIVISAGLLVAGFNWGVYLLVLSLIAMHVLAINNGLRMHGKINPLHHLARFVLSAVIVVLAYFGIR